MNPDPEAYDPADDPDEPTEYTTEEPPGELQDSALEGEG